MAGLVILSETPGGILMVWMTDGRAAETKLTLGQLGLTTSGLA